jgi:hypothetical protein
MLPIVHPIEKTKTDLKRSIQRLELYAKSNSQDINTINVLSLLKRAVEMLK